MKKLILIGIMGIAVNAKAQVLSGSAVLAGRKQVDSSEFIIYDKLEGMVEVEVSIDRLGNVTGVRLIGEGTTIKTTTSYMRALNAAKLLKFTPGTYYDKFQHARVRYVYKNENAEWEEEGED